MSDLYQFALLLGDLAPSIELIDGHVFLDRFNLGISGLREKIAKYPTLHEAKQWINMVPVDDLIDLAVPEWSMDDPTLEQVAAIFRRSWLAAVHAKCGPVEGLSVELLKDHEYGDVILRLAQV
jgi:hypothetical protein